MADLIWPLHRTLFLPAGCPGLGSVEQLQADLRDLRWGSSGGQSYCLGEADVLVEYLAPRPGGRPWEEHDADPGPWQALLSFPFQMSGPGSLPSDRACQIELSELSWTMVGSRALELQAALHISYQEQEPPPDEQPPSADDGWAEQWRQTQGWSLRPMLNKPLEQPWKTARKGGGWKMTEPEARTESQAKEVHQAASAARGPVSTISPVEIVDLRSGGDPLSLSRVIEEALRADGSLAELAAWRAQQQAAAEEQAAGTEPENELTEEAEVGELAEAGAEAADAVEAAADEAEEPVSEVEAAVDEVEAAADAGAMKTAANEAEATAPLAAEMTQISAEEDSEWVIEPVAGDKMEAGAGETADEAELSAVAVRVSADPETYRGPLVSLVTAEPAAVQVTKQTAEQAAAAETEPVTETAVQPPIEPVTEPTVQPWAKSGADLPVASVMAADVTAVDEAPPPAKNKRRFRGWPGLIVDSDHNDIDLTAFNICIKL